MTGERSPGSAPTTSPDVSPEPSTDAEPLAGHTAKRSPNTQQEPGLDGVRIEARLEREPGSQDRPPEVGHTAAGAIEPDPVADLTRGRDRTAQAVRRQLRAMGSDRFDLGIREAGAGRLMQIEASREEMLARLPQLKRLNAQGNDIYVRPARSAGPHGLVLIDDLTLEKLRALPLAGRDAAVVVETSPGNFQAWIRVARSAEDGERTHIARHLARYHDADPATGHAHPYGRLAGFTNRKPEHRSPEGLHPFALLRGASGRVAPDGPALVRQAARELERGAAPRPDLTSPVASSPGGRVDQEGAIELYRQEIRVLLRRTRDVSRADFGAAARLAARGFDAATIQHAMLTGSPNLHQRKRGHVQDYVERTVAAAIRAQAREATRERSDEPDGPER